MKNTLLATCTALVALTAAAQENLPTDYLTPAFHAGRREALRAKMPAHSVAVVFAYPVENFSRDVDYVYHPNPDLYYFSGYTEPSSVLLIFKERQGEGDSSYNEVLFVQHRDPQREQWTGRRLGPEGAKTRLGFARVYNSEDFAKFPVDWKKFTVWWNPLTEAGNDNTAGGLHTLVTSLQAAAGLKPVDAGLARAQRIVYWNATPAILPRVIAYLRPELTSPAFREDSLIQGLLAKPDSSGLAAFKRGYESVNAGSIGYINAIDDLRGIKMPEELALLKKSIRISALGHAEAMRAANPFVSERELEGVMLYTHKKYGAEEEGYPPIVGAGANGCILHYEENAAQRVDNQLVLMDVGAMYHGYSADVTRTFPANGKFSAEQKAVYQLVYEAQEAAFAVCRAGTTFDSLESKTRQVLAAGMQKLGLIKEASEIFTYYPHGMSHHLGLDVHDRGRYDTLRENMVVTVEPGIYIPAGSPVARKWWNIGVRIEDDVLVGDRSCTLLSDAAPRKWQDVEKTMAEKSIFKAGAPKQSVDISWDR